MNKQEIAAYAAQLKCPDCHSTMRLTDTGGNVYVATVLHDKTCPTFAAIERRQK